MENSASTQKNSPLEHFHPWRSVTLAAIRDSFQKINCNVICVKDRSSFTQNSPSNVSFTTTCKQWKDWLILTRLLRLERHPPTNFWLNQKPSFPRHKSTSKTSFLVAKKHWCKGISLASSRVTESGRYWNTSSRLFLKQTTSKSWMNYWSRHLCCQRSRLVLCEILLLLLLLLLFRKALLGNKRQFLVWLDPSYFVWKMSFNYLFTHNKQ